MKYYLFPKFFQEFSLEGMMDQAANLGFDGPTALVREGFWLNGDNLKSALPLYVAEAEKRSMEVKYASCDLALDGWDDPFQEKTLGILAQNGIEMVRMQHRGKRPTDDVRLYADWLANSAEKTEKAAKKAGIRCVIQIHGGCYPHNATSAYAGVKDLDPRYIGVKIDPGNNASQEGTEIFYYQIGLLREYIAALGAKDGAYLRLDNESKAPNKGWQPRFLPAYEGVTDFYDIFRLLNQYNLDVPAVLMPFYDVPKERFLPTVKSELEYFKQIEKSIKQEK